jgi:hypothetical protein
VVRKLSDDSVRRSAVDCLTLDNWMRYLRLSRRSERRDTAIDNGALRMMDTVRRISKTKVSILTCARVPRLRDPDDHNKDIALYVPTNCDAEHRYEHS